MADIPDIAVIASLIGDRARSAMLMSLMTGRALTASELARVARVSKPTASSHLAKLADGHLITMQSAGRHRYFRLADHEVGVVLEQLIGLAERTGAVTVNPGPRDPAMRKARVCYDHLAGDLAVLVFDSFIAREFLTETSGDLALTETGRRFCRSLAIDPEAGEGSRRPVCLPCLDWSARRHHLAGALGAALLTRFFELGWARRVRGSRTVLFIGNGEQALRSKFPVINHASRAV